MTLPYTPPTQMAISEICRPIKPLRCTPDCSFTGAVLMMMTAMMLMKERKIMIRKGWVWGWGR